MACLRSSKVLQIISTMAIVLLIIIVLIVQIFPSQLDLNATASNFVWWKEIQKHVSWNEYTGWALFFASLAALCLWCCFRNMRAKPKEKKEDLGRSAQPLMRQLTRTMTV
ncbi:hypothetical protein Zmor_012776 [Zophobas morio]|uniref:Transmembrane protein n=1 Tax=Zophobas morio TaxID=2755281 RepID=A0AA38MEZ7_9CUCU|nr:hypothetical protein Zmor_012776 [Zophobas morio]